MEKYPILSVHYVSVVQDGIEYAAVAQRSMPENAYWFVSLWDRAHQVYLPLDEIEAEYARQHGTTSLTVHSKRAARRRAKQYVRLWHTHDW